MNRFRLFLARASASIALLFTPLAFALAAVPNATGTLGAFLLQIVDIIDQVLVPVVFALAFITFVFGIYRTFIAGATNEEKRQEGQKLAIYGLIGFLLMFSVWGLVNLLLGTLGFNGATRPNLPTFNPTGSATITSPANTLPAAQTSTCPPGFTDTFDGAGCLNAQGQSPSGAASANTPPKTAPVADPAEVFSGA